MTHLVERLAELRQHVAHLRELAPRVRDAGSLTGDLSLQNDVLRSLLVVCQSVIDIAGELAARRGLRFQDYTEAIRALRQVEGIPSELVNRLEPLPGFRNVLVHEYVALDYGRVLEALRDLGPVEEFVRVVASLEGKSR